LLSPHFVVGVVSVPETNKNTATRV